jgi:small subunit ribosomal protein S16
MSVTIRLSRIGKKNAPFYRIVAIDSRKKRDGEYLENLGTYDPKSKAFIQFKQEALAAWISKGAEVSDTVARLLKAYKEVAKKAGVATQEAPAKAAVEKKAAKKKAAKKE